MTHRLAHVEGLELFIGLTMRVMLKVDTISYGPFNVVGLWTYLDESTIHLPSSLIDLSIGGPFQANIATSPHSTFLQVSKALHNSPEDQGPLGDPIKLTISPIHPMDTSFGVLIERRTQGPCPSNGIMFVLPYNFTWIRNKRL